MKSMLTTLFVMFFSASAMADIYLNEGEVAYIGGERVQCGGSSNNTYEAKSEVSLSCLDQMRSAYVHIPSIETILSWADQCRNSLNTSRCTLTNSQVDGSCQDKLLDFLRGRPSGDTLSAFATACQSHQYLCRL